MCICIYYVCGECTNHQISHITNSSKALFIIFCFKAIFPIASMKEKTNQYINITANKVKQQQ